MSHRDREPTGLTILKIIGAMILVLVALAFGAGGACGAVVAVGGIWDALSRRAAQNEYSGMWVIGAGCAVVGLSVAGLLVWGVTLMFRKKRDE
jgi:hypothetical protein